MASEDEKNHGVRQQKYALTLGIKKKVNRRRINRHAISIGMLCYGDRETAHGNDWHRTESRKLSPKQSKCVTEEDRGGGLRSRLPN